MQQKEILYNNKKIVYKTAGNGPAAVLVHGFGEDSFIWNEVVDALSADFFLIIPDLPGSGASEMIEDMSMEGLAEAIKAVVENELREKEKYAMIGHSMGGYITLAFAEKYESDLKGFGLFHSTAFGDTSEKKETRRKGIAFIKEHGAYEFLKATIPNLYASATKEANQKVVEQHVTQINYFCDAALIEYYESMMSRRDRLFVLQQTKLPVLFVLGRWDGAVSISDGLKQCYQPKNAYVHILENSGHMGIKEEPENSINFLKEYLFEIYQMG